MPSRIIRAIAALTVGVVTLIGASSPAYAQVKTYRDDTPEADQAIAAQQWPRAIAELDKRIASHPSDVQARFKRATVLAREGRDDDAIRALTDITQNYPELPEPYNNLAALYAKQGRFDLARTMLETALTANPNFALARRNLGDVYLHLAQSAYQRAAQQNPTDSLAQNRQRQIAAIVAATPASAAQTMPSSSVPTQRKTTAEPVNRHGFQPSLGGQPPIILPGVNGNQNTLIN